MEQFLYGGLTEFIGPAIAGLFVVMIALAYTGAALWLWTLFAAAFLFGIGAPYAVLIVFGIVALLFNVPPLRQNIVSGPVMKILDSLGFLPTISDTERIALDAGTVWVDGEFFSGKPNFKKILEESYPELNQEEKDFMNGPVEELCRLTDDWKIHQQGDLTPEVWDYIKKEDSMNYKDSIWYKIERFFDRHNHLMEFIRTIIALMVLFLQFYILSRL